MRLLILTADYPPANWSGIGITVERQARALAELGVEVHVAVASPSAPPCAWETQFNPSVRHLGAGPFPFRDLRFDWIHLHSLALSELAWELHRRFQIPVAYTVHTTPQMELSPGPVADFWQRAQTWVLGFARHVVFLSQMDRQCVEDRVTLHRASVIPNGLPRRPVPGSKQPDAEWPVVFAGRFTHRKGVELLEQVVPLVLSQRKAQFVLAGGHGDRRGDSAAQRMAERHGSQCRLTGWLAPHELERLFDCASLVVVPSYYEPFGLVALEAMQSGTPVLASNTGGLKEMMTADSGGILVAHQDPGEWSQAIIKLLADAPLRSVLRAQGPRYVADHFDIQRVSVRLLKEVYAAA